MTTNQNQPFHILGFGAIGMLLAAHTRLSFPLYPVHVLLRDHHRTRVRDGHVDVTIEMLQTGATRAVSVPATVGSEFDQPIQNLVVTTKAFDAVEAVRSVSEHLQSNTKTLVLCNGGLAVREELIKHGGLQREFVHAGTVTHGAYRAPLRQDESEEAYKVIHAGEGRIFAPHGLGHYSDVWRRLQCEVLSEEEMEVVLWKKLAANAVCNPLTALHGVKNGELYEVAGFETTMTAIVSEVVQVHNSVRLGSPLESEAIESFVRQVIDDNLENRSSMYQDAVSQRRTEIEYLNGFIVDAGKEHGIACPENEKLVSRVLSLESEYSG